MEIEVEKLPKNTLKIKVKVPKEKVKATYEEVVNEVVKSTEVKGFRKGKAPRKVVEKSLDQAKLRGEVLSKLLLESYSQAVKEHFLKPIVSPHLKVKKFELEEDLEFEAMSAEMPEVKIGDYYQALKELGNQKSKIKNQKVVYGPSGEPATQKAQKDKKAQKITIDEVIDALLPVCEVEIPDMLIEDEVNRMLSRLVDQTARLGLTVEQYLSSQGKTAEGLKSEYQKMAEKTLKTEFVLGELSKREEIKVEESEIYDTIKAAPDEKSREALLRPESRAYVESILLKNKAIQRLIGIAEEG